MDGDSLRSVRPGDSINIEAATWNSVMETARAYRGGRLDVKGGGSPRVAPGVLEVLVANYTGFDVPSGSYLAIHPPLNFPAGDVNGEFIARPYVTGIVPRTAEDDFVVLLEPIKSYDVGRAIMSGPFINPSFNVGNGDFLRCIPGNTTKLQQSQRGRARFISSSNSTIGSELAILGVPSDRSIYARITARAGGKYTFSEVDGTGSAVTGGQVGLFDVEGSGLFSSYAFDIGGAADDLLVNSIVLLWPYSGTNATYYYPSHTWAFGPYKKVVADVVLDAYGALVKTYRMCIGTPTPPGSAFAAMAPADPAALPFAPMFGARMAMPPAADTVLSPTSKFAVVTLAIGQKGRDLLAVSGPLMRAAAERWGADFHVIGGDETGFAIGEKLRLGAYVSDYDRTFYVDADALILPSCPNPFETFPAGSIYAHDDLRWLRKRGHATAWIEGETRAICESQGWQHLGEFARYWNSGVWLLDRGHAPPFMPTGKPYPYSHCAEQHIVCHMIRRAGYGVTEFGRAWNWQHWIDPEMRHTAGAHVLHFSGMAPLDSPEASHAARLALMRQWATPPVGENPDEVKLPDGRRVTPVCQ